MSAIPGPVNLVERRPLPRFATLGVAGRTLLLLMLALLVPGEASRIGADLARRDALADRGQ